MIEFISKLIRQFNNKIIFKCTIDQEKVVNFVREKLCGPYAITCKKKFKKRRVTSIPRKDSNDVAMSTVFYDPLGLDDCLSSSSNCSDGSVIFDYDESIFGDSSSYKKLFIS